MPNPTISANVHCDECDVPFSVTVGNPPRGLTLNVGMWFNMFLEPKQAREIAAKLLKGADDAERESDASPA